MLNLDVSGFFIPLNPSSIYDYFKSITAFLCTYSNPLEFSEPAVKL